MTRMNRPSLDLLKGKKGLIGAEIGVQSGVNAKWMLKNLDIEKLYLIDPYEAYPSNNKNQTLIGPFSKGKKAAKKALKAYEDKIEWVYKYSWDAIDSFSNQYFDFVYIDGDHREEAVLIDMNYAKKVKLGGLLCGHDWRFPSVQSGIGKWVTTNQFEFTCCNKTQFAKIIDKHVDGSDWWIEMPNAKTKWSQKCSQCQNVFNFKTKDVSWIN